MVVIQFLAYTSILDKILAHETLLCFSACDFPIPIHTLWDSLQPQTRSLTQMAPRQPARMTPVSSQCGSAFFASCSTA